MKEENKWRSPSGDYGPENGLDTGDVETFKKDPKEALARETAQNSNDARYDSSLTRIEYKLFEVERNNIPGIDDLSNMINSCYEYIKEVPKEADPLLKMLERSRDEKIKCLRVSDFHTTGLEGVVTNHREKPFYLLTKGSGISYKSSGSGGSKGIGKYAAFVNSNINTVFYSTYNKDEERGHIGVSKLRSAPIPGTDGQMTQGIAYYSRNEKKEPILTELKLCNEFYREDGDYGTDLYIIGFDAENNWKWTIISKILESFMVAIKEETLIVDVDDVTVSKDKLASIISDPNLKKVCSKILYDDIQAQYVLLFDKDVINTTIELDELGKVDVFVKKYDTNLSDMATQKCVYIRYPYMKIKMSRKLSKLPFSAMCIIKNNELNTLLRNVENPQHTDWEFNRLDDDKQLKKKTKNAEAMLKKKILNFVKEVLLADSTEETDVFGAGDFLPSVANGELEGEVNDEEGKKGEMLVPTRLRINKPKTTNIPEGDTGGDREGDTGGDREGDTRGDREGDTGGDTGGDRGEKIRLRNFQYRNIVVDEKSGKYDLKFKSPYDEADFELELKVCGDGNDRYPLDITRAVVNGKQCKIIEGKIRMSLKKDTVYVISYTTSRKIMFSSEVIFNAHR